MRHPRLLLPGTVMVAVLLLCGPALGQLVVRPAAGNLLGAATAPEPGKWIVFAAGFLPVQPTLLDGGRAIQWEGKAGTYAVIYLPPGDGQPVVQQVVLGGGAPGPEPKPDPPVPPVPPGDRWALVIEETDDRTPAQAALWVALRKEYSGDQLKILDQTKPPAQYAALFTAASAVPRPVLVVVADDGRLIRAVPCPTTVAAFKTELAR